jgi:hypothetical protein
VQNRQRSQQGRDQKRKNATGFHGFSGWSWMVGGGQMGWLFRFLAVSRLVLFTF